MLGVLMLLLALLAQPVCLLYTKSVMNHAAAQTARVLATAKSNNVARSFALRRLRAVPPASIFHVGGEADWVVDVDKSDGGQIATVSISGHVRPLPLLGVMVGLGSERDGVGVVVRVSQRVRIRQEWLEGGYDDWMSAWN